MSVLNPTLTYQVLDNLGNLVKYQESPPEFSPSPLGDINSSGNFVFFLNSGNFNLNNGNFNLSNGDFYTNQKIIAGQGIIQERVNGEDRNAIKFTSVMDGSYTGFGGYIDLSAGSAYGGVGGGAGGSIISLGSSDTRGNRGGDINLSAGNNSNGGSIDLRGDNYGAGGSISLRGNDIGNGGNISANGNVYGNGGSISMNASPDYSAGGINLNAGDESAGGSINLSNNGAANFSIQPGDFPQNDADGSIFNKINDNLYIKKNNDWKQVLIVSSAPVSYDSVGASGEIAFDTNYFYRHNGLNWTRTALSTW